MRKYGVPCQCSGLWCCHSHPEALLALSPPASLPCLKSAAAIENRSCPAHPWGIRTQGIRQQSTRWWQRSPSHPCSTCARSNDQRAPFDQQTGSIYLESRVRWSLRLQDPCSGGIDPVGGVAAMLHCCWWVQTPWGLVEVQGASRHTAETWHCDHC